MPQFHNPYFFLPITSGRSDTECVPFDDIAAGKTDNIRHDCYHPDYYSGKISCTLETVTPTFVGNRHTGGIKSIRSGHYEHYEINGQPALPANSLNGMIGSIMEALSRSAMRVIDNQPLFERKLPKDAISAIGRIIKRGKKHFIQPCTIPTTPCFIRGNTVRFKLKAPWKNIFSGCRLMDVLPIHIDHTTAENNWERDTDKYYFMLPKLADNLKIGSTDNFPKHTLKIKTITRNGRRLHFLLGQTPADSELYSERPKSHYIRGRMRDLNPQGDDDDFYRQHKYERFIPQPEAGSDHPLPREIHIPDEVINRYKRIAAHAKKLDDNYPLTPTGYPKLEIEDGMLMFFDINKDKYEKDGKLEVSELSHSSIWRQEFPHKDTESAIKALKESKNMLPWSSDRTHLTPAEQILGVAAEQTEETEDNKVSMLKGRIRFTDAKPLEQTGIERLPAQTLKILASPKPPSRYFYFHKTNKRSGNDDDRETNDRKHDLDINGRKYYLHQQEETVESTKSENKLRWWETKDTENISGTIHQKISCCPVDENQKFHFDIHFNNLSDAELGLLLTALNPGDGFVHRLGLGKPLGLGSVSIFIGRLEVLNARESYTGWSDTAIHQNKKECMEEFKKATQDTGWIDDCVLSVLKELGNPNKVTELVTYPVSHKQYDEAEKPEGEQELFQWFVENKKKGNNAQWLMKERLKDSCGSFSVFGTLLETLDADEKQKKRGKAQ